MSLVSITKYSKQNPYLYNYDFHNISPTVQKIGILGSGIVQQLIEPCLQRILIVEQELLSVAYGFQIKLKAHSVYVNQSPK